jgi:hypothetical protein
VQVLQHAAPLTDAGLTPYHAVKIAALASARAPEAWATMRAGDLQGRAVVTP